MVRLRPEFDADIRTASRPAHLFNEELDLSVEHLLLMELRDRVRSAEARRASVR
jgi:hypothetical protein